MLRRFIPFGEPKVDKATELAILRTLRSGWIGAGPITSKFEDVFAKYIGVHQAVALSSCTAGLHLSLLVSGVGPEDEVITTPLTFVATANAILHAGAKVVFADVDPYTYNLSPDSVRAMRTQKTRAIMPVHFGGLPCDLDALRRVAKSRKIAIIEDAAHAIGAKYKGKLIGASGNLVVFSLYPNKNITSCEGGMITLQNKRMANRLRILRMHGLDADAWKRFYRRSLNVSLAVELGYKYNLTDLQVSLGIHQLAHVEEWQRKREHHAKIYDTVFSGIRGVSFQFRPKNTRMDRHALHLYLLRLDPKYFGNARDKTVRTLLRRNIGASIHYFPVHLHPAFRKFGYRKGDFPVAEKIAREVFTLPLTPHLSQTTIRAIAQITKNVLLRHSKMF